MTRTIAGLALMGLLSCGGTAPDPGRPAAQGVTLIATGGVAGSGARSAGGPRSTRTLAAGVLLDASTGRLITSRATTPGETLKATVYADAVDDIGRVVIPAGALIELMVTEITPAGDRSGADGTITLVITGVVVEGRHYSIAAVVTSMYHTLQGRRLAPEEVAAFDTPYGVVAGRVVGRDAMGTIIGGAVRPLGGTAVEFQAAGRDVVVLGGTPIVITLTAPLTTSSW